jgi:stage II sporulation protein D
MPLMRVRLGDELPRLQVAVAGPWRLTANGAELASGQDLGWTDVALCEGAIQFGRQRLAWVPLELAAEQDGGIWVCQKVNGADRERSYRGRLQLVPTAAGMLCVVNVLPLEHYLAGVLANEMLRSWHVEAYKAQAVAARTYALCERNGRTRYDFDVYDTVQSQVYGGCGTETQTAWDAVVATWGVVATYRGADGRSILLKTYFHSTCGGRTVPAGSVFGGPTPGPLAGGVECPYCRRSPRYRWGDAVLTKQEIGEALRGSGVPELVRLGPVERVEVAQTSGPGGRAEQIRVVDAAGASVLIRADYWRSLMRGGKVYSTWFDIADRGDRIVLTGGRGYGHGVGLCQYGAEYLAERGMTGEQILRFYYPGVELTRAY